MKNIIKRNSNKALIASILFGCASVAQAVVINIDFGTGTSAVQTGLAAANDSAGAAAVWNGVSAQTATGLLDSLGNITTVGITTGSGSRFSGPVDQELLSGQADLLGDYVSSRAADNGFDLRTNTISGLVAGNAYDIFIYGQGDNFTDVNNNGGQNLGVQIGDEVLATSHDGVNGGDGILAENIEFIRFQGIVADANGDIIFNSFNPGNSTDAPFDFADPDGNVSRFSAINGIQIVGVPEPSSVALLGIGFVGFALRRRR